MSTIYIKIINLVTYLTLLFCIAAPVIAGDLIWRGAVSIDELACHELSPTTIVIRGLVVLENPKAINGEGIINVRCNEMKFEDGSTLYTKAHLAIRVETASGQINISGDGAGGPAGDYGHGGAAGQNGRDVWLLMGSFTGPSLKITSRGGAGGNGGDGGEGGDGGNGGTITVLVREGLSIEPDFDARGGRGGLAGRAIGQGIARLPGRIGNPGTKLDGE